MSLAYVRLGQLDMAAAATEYNRGHALAGGSADDLLDYAEFLWIIGRPAEALSLARQAQSLDPLNPAAFSTEASCQRLLGRYDLSEAAYRKALALKPKALLDRAFFAVTLSEEGKADEATAQFRQLPPDYLFRLVGEAILFAHQGNRAASDAAFSRAQQVLGDSANYQYADIHAQRGEKDQAFASLERAWSFRDPGLAYMKSDLWLAPLRSDPRFTALLQKMNFPA